MNRLLLLALCGASFFCAVSAHSEPKRMGPSAVEAARLKANPPRGYLSHYLPDDRYKIAGGVWRYVSTDLDTYYHLPSSPNMLRQPADRVIGFSSAKDAEEAGYTADPTDGTAGAAATAPTPSAQSDDYLSRLRTILTQSQEQQRAMSQQMLSAMRSSSGNGSGSNAQMRAFLSQFTNSMRTTSRAIAGLAPPPRYRRFHSLLLSNLRDSIGVMNELNQVGSMGRISDLGTFLNRMQGHFQRSLALNQQLAREARRLGLTSELPGFGALAGQATTQR